VDQHNHEEFGNKTGVYSREVFFMDDDEFTASPIFKTL
jgi:hypothetical protein